MRDLVKNENDRVGMYLKPYTRNRLNKFKADVTLATGKTMSQDDAINCLLDHYAATVPQLAGSAVEFA